MARKIWKFPLEVTDVQMISIPEDWKILSVGMQGDTPTIWADVNPNLDLTQIKVVIVGTGNPMPDWSMQFIGTVIQGQFVWHVFIKV